MFVTVNGDSIRNMARESFMYCIHVYNRICTLINADVLSVDYIGSRGRANSDCKEKL